MKFTSITKKTAAFAIAAATLPAFSHVALDVKTAPAGSSYKAVFQISHGCAGSATTGVAVQIPAGFQSARPYPKAGWNLSLTSAKLDKPYESGGKQVSEDVSVVSWTAASKDAALQDAHFDEFMLRGKLPDAAGPLWFKVLQTCENGSTDWSEIPASGLSARGLKSPAAMLEVTAAGATPALVPVAAQTVQTAQTAQTVQIRDAWVRATVAGQKGTGAFMNITAKTAMRLTGVASPVAGVADVHEMKMDGGVMKMRAITALNLPAGKTVELKSGGAYHVMLMDLKQPLASGSRVPLTLTFRDSKNNESKVELSVPVAVSAPGAGAAPAAKAEKSDKAGEHDHSKH